MDYPLGERVSQRGFQAVADFDPDLAFLHGYEEQRAVVPAFLAESPGSGDAHRVVFERFPFEAGNEQNRDLGGVRDLELPELFFEICSLLWCQHSRQIRYSRLEFWNIEGKCSGRQQPGAEAHREPE